MNIIITTEKKVIDSMIDTTTEIVREFNPSKYDSYEIDRLKHRLDKERKHSGPANSWKYTVDNDTRTIDLTVDDEAILMALPMAVKVAKVISPLYDMAMSAVKLCRNLRGQFDSIGNDFCKKFDKRFGKAKKYAVGSIWCEELEMFDVVVIEDDGFDNIHVTDAYHCGRVNPMSTINRFALATMKKGEDTKDSMTMRHPQFEFVERTRDEAREIARDLRKGLQVDVDNYYTITEDESEDKYIDTQTACDDAENDDNYLLGCSGDNTTGTKYALVIIGINSVTGSDCRKYAAILNQNTNAPVEDIMTVFDCSGGRPDVDLSKIVEVVMAKSRVGGIRYEYDNISDIRDAILIMQNDTSYYESHCEDTRVNFMKVNPDVVYKKTEE